jgi:hypothetical protein
VQYEIHALKELLEKKLHITQGKNRHPCPGTKLLCLEEVRENGALTKEDLLTRTEVVLL